VELKGDITVCGKVFADPIGLHQIVVNLCTNAFHAMNEQKGTITLSLQRQELTYPASSSSDGTDHKDGEYAVLTIEDDGCGMDQVTQERIFEPYFSTKEQKKGTGLGMAVVHGIVQNYGGFITVDSVLGKGTLFQVYLPTCDEKEETAETADEDKGETADTLNGTERLLVVDDEELLVRISKRYFESFGYTVTTMTDSMEALEAVRSNPEGFDLVISDQTMPRLTGSELAAELMQIRPDLPIILCTGHSDIINEEKALALGIKRYVFKPVEGDKLGRAVREVLNARETPEGHIGS